MATRKQISREAERKRQEREREAEYKRYQKELAREHRARELSMDVYNKEMEMLDNRRLAEQAENYLNVLDKMHQFDVDIEESVRLFKYDSREIDFEPYRKLPSKEIPAEIDTENVTFEEYKNLIGKDHGVQFPFQAGYIISKTFLLTLLVISVLFLFMSSVVGVSISITMLVISVFAVKSYSSKKQIYINNELLSMFNMMQEKNKELRRIFFEKQERSEKLNYDEYLKKKELHIENQEYKSDISKKVMSGDDGAILKLLSLFLPLSLEAPPVFDIVTEDINDYRIGFYAKNNNIYMAIKAPSEGVIPTHEIKISAARNNLSKSKLSDKFRDNLYRRFICSFALGHCLYILNKIPFVKKVYIDVYEQFIDPSTGQISDQITLSIAFDPACLKEINFSRTDAFDVYDQLDYEECDPGEKSEIKGHVDLGLLTYPANSNYTIEK